jgi:hypothetical protein
MCTTKSANTIIIINVLLLTNLNISYMSLHHFNQKSLWINRFYKDKTAQNPTMGKWVKCS